MFPMLLTSTFRTGTPLDISLQVFAERRREDKGLKAVRHVVGILLTVFVHLPVEFRLNLIFPIQSQANVNQRDEIFRTGFHEV